MTTLISAEAIPHDATTVRRPSRLSRLHALVAPSSLIPTYAGVLVIAVGFGLIALAWAEVAGLANVALQMPYLISAGLTGLGLVMVGLIVVNIAAKRQDGAERARQMEALRDIMAELCSTVEKLERERPAKRTRG